MDGNLTPKERKVFEKLIDESDEIRDEVTLTRGVIAGIEGYAFKQMLKKIQSEYLHKAGRRKPVVILRSTIRNISFFLVGQITRNPVKKYFFNLPITFCRFSELRDGQMFPLSNEATLLRHCHLLLCPHVKRAGGFDWKPVSNGLTSYEE